MVELPPQPESNLPRRSSWGAEQEATFKEFRTLPCIVCKEKGGVKMQCRHMHAEAIPQQKRRNRLGVGMGPSHRNPSG